MNNQKVKQCLIALAEELDSVYAAINYGGCGVIAYMVGKQLMLLGVTVEVVTPSYSSNNAPSNCRKAVSNFKDYKDWNGNGLDRSHLAIRFRLGKRLWTWDSNGLQIGGSTFGKDRYFDSNYRFGKGMSIDECKLLAGSPAGWNTCFDRKNILPIQRIVKKHFQQLKGQTS